MDMKYIRDWLEHPVTEGLMEVLEEFKESLSAGLASGSHVGEMGVRFSYGIDLGKLEVIKYLLAIKDDPINYKELFGDIDENGKKTHSKDNR